MTEFDKAITQMWADYMNYCSGLGFKPSPDELYKSNPAEYERQMQEMVKSSKLYEAPKDNKLEYNDYED